MKRVLTGVVGLALVLAFAAGVGLAWLLGTQEGLRWALARAVAASQGRLAVEEARGALAGTVTLARFGFHGDGFGAELRKVSARVDLLAALSGRIALDPLHAESLTLTLGEEHAPPSTRSALAFGARIASAEVDELIVLRGAERYALREVRVEHATVGPGAPATVAALATFRVADERFPAAGRLELAGTLAQTKLTLRLDQGATSVEASALLEPSAPQILRSLEARAGPIDLARFDAALPRTALELTLSGSPWAADALRGTLAVRNAEPGALDRGRAPFVRADARFATRDFSALRLDSVRVALAGGGLLEGEAFASFERFNALLQASGINLRALRTDLRPTRLRGPLEVAMTRETQSIDASFAQEGMNLDARAVRRGSHVEIRRLRAWASGGEVRGTGTLALEGRRPFRGELVFSRFNPAAFGDYPEGALSGSASVAGRLAPAYDIEARWTIADSTLNGLPLESRGRARFAKAGVAEAEIVSQLGETRASARGAFGRPGDELVWTLSAPRLAELNPRLEGRLRASGVLSGSWQAPQGRLDALAESLRIGDGPLLKSATARLYGSLARHEVAIALRGPDLDLEVDMRGGWGSQGWTGQLRSAVNRGAYPLQLAAPATLGFAQDHFQLGRLEARIGDGRLLVEDLRWAPGALASRGEFTRLPAHWLTLALGAVRQVDGDLTLDGEWSVAAQPRIDGYLRLRRAGGDLALLGDSRVDLGLREALLDARFARSRVTLSARVASRFGDLDGGGEITPAADASGFALGADSVLALQGRIAFADVRVLSRALLQDGRIDGKLDAQLKASGTLGEPLLAGQVRGDALALELPPYGVFLRNGTLRANLQGDRLQIESFTIGGGDGELSASGFVPLRLGGGEARIAWSATRFKVIDRPELLLVASGKGEAHFDGKRLALSGDLRADRGKIEVARERLPKLGDDIRVVGGERPAARRRGPIPVKLDMHLDLGDNLEIRAQGLEGKLTGHVDFATNEDGELRAWGKVQTLNATFFAYGQKLQVEPGILIFDGPIDNPTLQVTAWRRNLPVEAGVQVSGTARAPRVQMVSQPPVPEGERLSWLVLGRPPSDATKADLGMLQAAAGALLSRGDTMPLDRRIARAFGLDEVSFRGTGEAQDRVVALGKRLSDRLYISYEQGIGAVASNLVKMDYSLSRRWSLRAETGTSSGGGVFYRFSWD